MKLRYVVIAATAFSVGWYARTIAQVTVTPSVADEIVANETICRDDTPKGYVAYVVTKNGELRGCLRVRENANDWTLPKQTFVRKTP